MRALVKYKNERGAVEIRDIEEPAPESGWVKVKVESAGICGSDIHILDNTIKIETKPPVVIGHEFSGVIVETGENVKIFRIGDRVVCETSIKTCGSCVYCRSGRINLCRNREVLGYFHDGVFAEYTVLPESKLHRIPDTVDFDSAALTEPLACCVHGLLENTCIRVEDKVAIAGPGPIGLLSALLVMSQGARVYLLGTENDAERLRIAEALGVEQTICVGKVDPIKALDEASLGRGMDGFVDCSGAGPAINLGLQCLKPHGYFTQVGLPDSPVRVNMEWVAYKELRVTGAISQLPESWELALKLLGSGKVDVKPLITERIPLTEWQHGFDRVRNQKGLKIIMKP